MEQIPEKAENQEVGEIPVLPLKGCVTFSKSPHLGLWLSI
jgi:hypothetical protein